MRLICSFASPLLSLSSPSSAPLTTLSLHDALPIWAALALRLVDLPRASGRRPGTRPPRAEWPLSRALAGSRIEKRSEEHTSELQSLRHLVCRLLLEKKNSGSVGLLIRMAITPRPQRRWRRALPFTVPASIGKCALKSCAFSGQSGVT